MLTMEEPLKISWDELSSNKVDAKLQRLDAVAKAREQYEKPSAPSVLPAKASRFAFIYNSLVYMSLFGALGGLVGWGFGEIMNFRPNPQLQARELIDSFKTLQTQIDAGTLDATTGAAAQRELARSGRHNDYFNIFVDPTLSPDQKNEKTAAIQSQDAWKDFIANVLFFGVSGMMIATALSAAESIVSRNARGAILNGSVGAAFGLIGGVAVALCIDKLYAYIVGGLEAGISADRAILVRSITWGVMGLFIAAAPGLVLQNAKRLTIGMIGGLVGGLIGGALFDPIAAQTGNQHVSRLVAIVIIGLVAGFGTGLLENAVKSGWLKVKEGLIAGKQFVLYRNPTFIGSAPNCHVYLFRDARVGRRHAAIHVVPGGFEIEDLPLGERTRVNGRTITRARLKAGDRIEVGQTVFEFGEKAKQQAA